MTVQALLHILRLPKVKERTGVSRATIYALMARDQFPKPIPLGARAVGWLSSDIDAWIEQRIQARNSENTRPSVYESRGVRYVG